MITVTFNMNANQGAVTRAVTGAYSKVNAIKNVQRTRSVAALSNKAVAVKDFVPIALFAVVIRMIMMFAM